MSAANLESIADRIRADLDRRNAARERVLVLSREIIRSCANSTRAVHRGDTVSSRELLDRARESLAEVSEVLRSCPELSGAGYVHDCQKEFAEASAFAELVAGRSIPDPADLGIECAAYLNGLGETVGELRRHTLDVMRQGDLRRAEGMLALMDEIFHTLVTIDYPDALTGGLRRTTDSVRGIIEKTRGEMTTALRQEELRQTLERAMRVLGRGERPD